MPYSPADIPNDHPVRKKLRDGEQVGLVLEGGAMRGVVVAGAVLALEQLGLRDSFGSLYGASAGALSAAYFAAGQATWGTSIFYDDLLRRDFFSWRRALRGDAPMNTDFVIQGAITENKPLDTERALRSDLHVFASDARSGDLVMWDDFEDKEDLLGALRAAIAMPFIAGGPVEYRGGQFFDAGVHTSVPWQEALGDGNSHLLVLLSRPKGSPRQPVSRLEHFLARNFLAGHYPHLVPRMIERVDSYNRSIQELLRLEKEGAPILVVAPEEGLLPVPSFERRRHILLEGARQGAEALYRTLFGSSPHFYEMLVSSENEGRPLWGGPLPQRRRRWKLW